MEHQRPIPPQPGTSETVGTFLLRYFWLWLSPPCVNYAVWIVSTGFLKDGDDPVLWWLAAFAWALVAPLLYAVVAVPVSIVRHQSARPRLAFASVWFFVGITTCGITMYLTAPAWVIVSPG